ncbi:MAG: HAMP domain-containing protein [Gammaproteobacteria bacterium]|nr:HAMP domain-containing protein [Gammaproteobacteria bacterium]MBT3722272.1 HAMP domain-containing protein [Gammaproteobacteria bacterium]MBT4450602.1 HAMP domain-containing protein [Gammaproteobacteria bacterium]MBT4863372.1 HAMP domain-containing protein [Gammaproteobacteria bacterium]MBT6454167.1 HAMP domain-containing protein [Gammaproteobacteria bacterium]
MNSALRNSAPIIALIILLFVSLYSISDATSNSASFGKYYNLLVFFNALGLIVLLGLIVYNVFKLIIQYRLKAVGSRLTTRMMSIFVILTIIPVSIVYYFSLTFLHSSIDSWFDVGVEQALEDSLKLGRSALDLRKREALKKTRLIANEIPSVPEEVLIVYLNDALNQQQANELTVVGLNGVILASSSENSAEMPTALAKTEFGELGPDDHFLKLEENQDVGLRIRIVVPVFDPATIEQKTFLQALFPITDRVNELTQAVEQAYEKYRELSVLRDPLKTSFTMALSLVWLLSVLSAIWIAFLSARKLVSPINDLVEGTQAVAAGDYEKQLPLSGDDELGFLTRSFNTMTRKISRARAIADQSQMMEELQKSYLESVLEHIISGVMTINESGAIKQGNRAAEIIFGLDEGSFHDQTVKLMQQRHPQLKLFFEVVKRNIQSQQEWQEEVTLFGRNGRKVLRVRGTELEQKYQDTREQVVVIDDLTALIQAQKDSAWSEMARRLAHEIKNPLTPIQLSAERLQGKLAGQVDEAKQEMLDRYTHTIVQQVEAMKSMVNSFTEYARAPSPSLQKMNLNQMVTEVVQLYLENRKEVEIRLSLDECMSDMQADPVRIRQLIHNLVKNASEAVDGRGWISLKTVCIEEHGCYYTELTVEDSGAGIKEEVMGTLFEPYVTAKKTGSGLGLAIVKKIVDEHNGLVWAENNEAGGARFVLRLPVMKDD